MKVPGCTSFEFFALLAISLVFACNELVNCSFADEKSGSSGVPVPKVNVLPPSLPLLSSEAAPSSADRPMAQVPFAEMLPCELWPEIFSSCTTDSLRSCIQVCSLWKNLIRSNYMITKLCVLGVEDEANFERLLLVFKQNSREEIKGLLQRIHDEKLVPPKVLMDLIGRLFMVDDVFSIVISLLRDPSIPMSKLFVRNCSPRSVELVFADTQRAKRNLRFTSELVKAVFKDLTPENFRPWLALPHIFRQLIEEAREENTALALRIYRQHKGAIHHPASDFPTLSCIEPILPLIFPVPWLPNENGEVIFFAYRFYLHLANMRSTETTMPKEMTDKILDVLSLVEINEQSLKWLVPHLCPSFLKAWKERDTAVGKPIITEFLNILEKFRWVNQGISYGVALLSLDALAIKRAIESLAKIKSVPFFVYRPLIVRCIDILPWDFYDASRVPFSGIEYPPCFMEDLYVLALAFSGKVHTFLKVLDPTQRSRLVSYSTVLTDKLLSRFKKHCLNCEFLLAVPSSP